VSSLFFGAKRSVAVLAGEVNRCLIPRSFSAGRIAAFHAIDTQVDGDINGIYNMTSKCFKSHILAINEARQRHDELSLLQFGKNPSKGVSITFDDGYATTLSMAAPVLAKFGMPFHVFVSPGLVESGDPRFMDRRQLKELAQIPEVTIGTHGYHHVPLSSLPPLRQFQDLSAAKHWLEDIIQIPVTTMSYPFGDTPQDIQSVVRESGYSVAACSIWGFNDEQADRLMLKRIDFWNGDAPRIAITKLLGYWNWIGNRSQV
jgi:peptidoglycan/xylan/chitin deacetylase (PgdA/CDA1 family)